METEQKHASLLSCTNLKLLCPRDLPVRPPASSSAPCAQPRSAKHRGTAAATTKPPPRSPPQRDRECACAATSRPLPVSLAAAAASAPPPPQRTPSKIELRWSTPCTPLRQPHRPPAPSLSGHYRPPASRLPPTPTPDRKPASSSSSRPRRSAPDKTSLAWPTSSSSTSTRGTSTRGTSTRGTSTRTTAAIAKRGAHHTQCHTHAATRPAHASPCARARARAPSIYASSSSSSLGSLPSSAL